MKTKASNKVTIAVVSQEQQENVKNSRKTLKILQEAAGDKENLAGRSRIVGKSSKLAGDNEDHELKRKKLVHKGIQTGEAIVTAADLTSTEEPSADYWRLLAEKRQDALNESLQENERLKEHIEALEEEKKIMNEMLQESKHLVDILKEMVEEGDASAEVAEEATESI